MISPMRANRRVIGTPVLDGNISVEMCFLVFRIVAHSVRKLIQIPSNRFRRRETSYIIALLLLLYYYL